MGLKEVKLELNKFEKKVLIKIIAELYKKFKPVKEYLDFYIEPNESKVLKIYKERVLEGFYPKRGYALKLSVARKAINDFKKLECSKESIADLLLYYVECGVRFTNDFGEINENYYISIENAYAKALELMKQEGVLSKFKDRAYNIVQKTEGIGWGFHDELKMEYYKYYE